MSEKPGLFISFEGGEGSGKTTQIRRLEEWFRHQGRDVVVTREPGGSPGAEEIRNLLLTGDPGRWDAVTEAFLMFASRRDHVERTIRPALADGKVVLCDRFADSSVAYQGYGHGLGAEYIRNLWALAIGDFKPDLTLIFDLPIEVGLGRAGARFAKSALPKIGSSAWAWSFINVCVTGSRKFRKRMRIAAA